MRRILLALALLCACPSTALHSTLVPGLWVQQRYTLNTSQVCLDAPELLACAEQIASKLIDQAVALGAAPSRAAAIKLWTRPGVCLIAHPEPCRLGEWCAQGSQGQDCLPRAGCTIDISSWVSREWPTGRAYDYSGTLEAELRVSLANRLPKLSARPQHDTPWERMPSVGVRCEWR